MIAKIFLIETLLQASVHLYEPRAIARSIRTDLACEGEVVAAAEPFKTKPAHSVMRRPQYRLRIDEVRVCYDVLDATVEILAIVAKSVAETWLARFGNPL